MFFFIYYSGHMGLVAYLSRSLTPSFTRYLRRMYQRVSLRNDTISGHSPTAWLRHHNRLWLLVMVICYAYRFGYAPRLVIVKSDGRTIDG